MRATTIALVRVRFSSHEIHLKQTKQYEAIKHMQQKAIEPKKKKLFGQNAKRKASHCRRQIQSI